MLLNRQLNSLIKMKKGWISYVAIILSVVAILLVIFRITPIEFTNETYIGLIATFIGISVTLLIGYQIINTIEIKREISEQKKVSNKLMKMYDEISQNIVMQKNEMQEGFDILNTLINYQVHGFKYSIKAFTSLHHALISSLNTNRKDYEWIFNLLRMYISNINWQNIFEGSISELSNGSFVCSSPGTSNYNKDFRECVKEFTKIVDIDEEILTQNNNFIRIQIEYNKVMKLFRKRIDELLLDPIKELTIEEKENIRSNR